MPFTAHTQGHEAFYFVVLRCQGAATFPLIAVPHLCLLDPCTFLSPCGQERWGIRGGNSLKERNTATNYPSCFILKLVVWWDQGLSLGQGLTKAFFFFFFKWSAADGAPFQIRLFSAIGCCCVPPPKGWATLWHFSCYPTKLCYHFPIVCQIKMTIL